MNFDEVKHQIQNPVAGDVLTFEFGDALAIDTPIIEVHGDNILVYTDEIAGKLINTLEAEYRGRKVKLNKPTRGDVSKFKVYVNCLLYTSPSPRDRQKSRMPSSA